MMTGRQACSIRLFGDDPPLQMNTDGRLPLWYIVSACYESSVKNSNLRGGDFVDFSGVGGYGFPGGR